jgi:ankyrin repeat protein
MCRVPVEIIDLLESKGGQTTERSPPDVPSEDQLLQSAREVVSGGGNVDRADPCGRTALHRASWYGYKNLVDFLLDKGASPNATDKLGFTPLHCAVMHSHLETAKALIHEGADVNWQTHKEGFAPIHFAFMAKEKKTRLVRLLIDHRADVNLTADPSGGKAPLHMAVVFADIGLARLLLDNGADVNVRNKAGATPLHEAARMGLKQMVTLFIENGAEINARDQCGATPLDYAMAYYLHVKAVAEILRKYGGKPGGGTQENKK